MRSLGSIRLILALAVTFSAIALSAQTATDATATTIQVPRLIRINGILAEPPAASGNSRSIDSHPINSRSIDLAFSLYAEEAGGEPLWQETQRVEVDATGHYSALLGSTQPEGLPTELFKSAQAQWLGVARQGDQEQPRIMLVSVPFALKAGDAETLGGKPASAFAPAVPSEIASPSRAPGLQTTFRCGQPHPRSPVRRFMRARRRTIWESGRQRQRPHWKC
jgi:trimeric autotransporter adhesin